MLSHQQEEYCCSFWGSGSQRKGKSQIQDLSDAHLAKEMNELSFHERERILDEIHGVAQAHEETPEFVAKRLKELELEISKIPKLKRKAYERALFFKPSIREDVKFKLMFLRADDYDGAKAAKRLIKYFEDKLFLFGEEKLARDIRLEDLSKEDMEVFETGPFLHLPHKDQAGRPILLFDIPKYDFDRTEAMLRCCWYVMMVSLQDEAAQKKGICDVCYSPGDLFTLPASASKLSNFFKRGGDVLNNIPMRITSVHFCYDDARMELLLSTIRIAFGKSFRLRVRTHFGSELEMQYSLSTFGVPCQGFLQPDGNTKHEMHMAYIQRRRETELDTENVRKEEEIRTGVIFYPQPTDVLIGRGRPYQEFPGNRRFGRLIDLHLDRYHKVSDRFGKTCLSMDIVKTVQAYGGRFIERTKSGTWQVIDDVVAREKTAIGFRSRVSKVTPDVKTPRLSGSNLPSSQPKRVRYDTSVTQ